MSNEVDRSTPVDRQQRSTFAAKGVMCTWNDTSCVLPIGEGSIYCQRPDKCHQLRMPMSDQTIMSVTFLYSTCCRVYDYGSLFLPIPPTVNI